MALDFTTGVLDSRVTFTRSTTGTFINSTGVLTTAAINAPRFDYDPITFAPLGLLIEESRTNNLVNSEDLAAATNGVPINVTITSNATNFIDGNLVADQVLETAATGLHAQDLSGFAFVAGTTYTYSIFLKSINGRNCSLFFPAVVFTGRQANFDLTNGVVLAAASGVTATIKNYGNGWYRCSISEVCAVTAGARPTYILFNGATSYAGDVTKGVFVCGYQLEVGAFPTSYIPTVGSTVTRTADVAVMTGTNFSDWFNASEGAFVAKGTSVNVAAIRALFSVVKDVSNIGYAGVINATGSSCGFNIYNDAVVYQGTAPFPSIAANQPLTIAGAYKTNNSNAAINVNGTIFTAADATTVTLPTGLTQLSIGAAQSNSVRQWNGWVQKFFYYKQRLINAELAAFSK
jgi:hypothetical protein